jgi:multidrug efflux pump subunit AcrA (membrane-fusion protein)
LLTPGLVAGSKRTVASESVVQRAGKDYVFIEEGGGLRPVPVKVLRRQGGMTVLGGGINAGTRVASKGIAALKGSWMGLGTAAAGNE